MVLAQICLVELLVGSNFQYQLLCCWAPKEICSQYELKYLNHLKKGKIKREKKRVPRQNYQLNLFPSSHYYFSSDHQNVNVPGKN
jgi:hypothetical protein